MTFGFHKAFPVDAVRPLGGELAGTIGHNSLTRKPLGLEHEIRVELAPFSLGRVVQDTAVTLFWVPLGIRSWRELAGRHYAFPRGAPELPPMMSDGEALPRTDQPRGATRLLGHHLAVRATRIDFGPIARGAIAAEFALTLELDPIRYAKTELSLPARLRLAGVRVVGDIAKLARPALDEAHELAGRFLDLDDYEARLIAGVVTYCPLASS